MHPEAPGRRMAGGTSLWQGTASKIALVAATLLGTSSCSSKGLAADYWEALPDEQKDGFVSGLGDCYIFEKEIALFPAGSRMQLYEGVSRAYAHAGSDRSAPLNEVYLRLVPQKGRDTLKGVERHTYFDGEMWRQFFTTAVRMEFVRGYTLCAEGADTAMRDDLISRYEKQISEWYGISAQDVAELDPTKEHDKIADVLGRVRGQAK